MGEGILFLAVAVTGAQAAPGETAFSTGEDKIAFTSDRTTGPGVDNPTGDDEIFTMNRDGTGLEQPTFNMATDFEPAYSPNGERIVFTSTRDKDEEVYEMKADGSKPTSPKPCVDLDPTWQPNKKK